MKGKNVFGFVALAIVAILGISFVFASPFGKGPMQNGTNESRAIMNADRDAMQTAIENKDFSAWKGLMEKRVAEMQAQITQENFDKMVAEHAKMAELRQERQVNGAGNQEGFGQKGGFGKGRMPGKDCPMSGFGKKVAPTAPVAE